MPKDSSGQRKALTVPFDPQALAKFSAFCEQAGVSMAEMIRSFVDMVNADGVAGELALERYDDGRVAQPETFEVRKRLGVVSLALLDVVHDRYSPYLIMRPGGAMAACVYGEGWRPVGPQGLDVLTQERDA